MSQPAQFLLLMCLTIFSYPIAFSSSSFVLSLHSPVVFCVGPNNSQPLLLYLRASTSCSHHLLPRLPVPSVFTSETRRRQFICKMWIIKLDFLCFILCDTVYNTDICLYLCLCFCSYLNSNILSPNRRTYLLKVSEKRVLKRI